MAAIGLRCLAPARSGGVRTLEAGGDVGVERCDEGVGRCDETDFGVLLLRDPGVRPKLRTITGDAWLCNGGVETLSVCIGFWAINFCTGVLPFFSIQSRIGTGQRFRSGPGGGEICEVRAALKKYPPFRAAAQASPSAVEYS